MKNLIKMLLLPLCGLLIVIKEIRSLVIGILEFDKITYQKIGYLVIGFIAGVLIIKHL